MYTTNAATPMRAALTNVWLSPESPKTVGSVRIGSMSRPPTPRSEDAASPPAAASEFTPAVASIRYWTAAPAAAPPGSVLVTVLPASPAVTTANHPRVRRTMRWIAKLQTKLPHSNNRATKTHTPLNVANFGHAPKTAERLGSTT